MDVPNTESEDGYEVFEHQDLQNYFDLSLPSGASCIPADSDSNWTNPTSDCAGRHNNQCCLDLSSANNTVSGTRAHWPFA